MTDDRDENEVTLTTADLRAIRDIVRAELAALKGGTHAAPQTTDAGRANAAPVPAPASAVFPPYGKSKGEPVRGASLKDLDYYANGCRRTLDDPNKSRWHDKERALLATIEGEIAFQQRGGQSSPRDAPPPDFGTGGDPDGIPF